MNTRERVEVKKEKNNDSLPCYPMHRQCLSRKIPIEQEQKEERKKEKKNTDRT